MADDIKQDEVKACGVNKFDDKKDAGYGGGMMGGAPCCLSFAELDAYELAQETAEEMTDATQQFSMLASNIMNSDVVEDKATALQALAKEFQTRIKQPVGMQKEVKEYKTYEDAVKSRSFGELVTDYYELVDEGVLEL